MKKQQHNKLIPELRFPEFLGDGEWENKKLEEVGENIMYGLNAAAKEFDGTNKYLRITDIDEETRLFMPNPLMSPNGHLEEKYLLKAGDLIFARTGASVGKSYLHKANDDYVYFAGFLIRFTIKNAIPYFVYLQTLTERFQRWVIFISLRSGQPGINAEEYKSYRIYLPKNIQEQRKIAACLSSLDEVIELEREKLTALQQHKKGLLQKLFPAEGKKVPEFRFPEFRKNGDWEEKKLGEIYSFKVTNSLSRDKLNFKTGKVKNIHYGDIHTKFSLLFDIRKEQVPFINPDVPVEKFSAESYCKQGDLVFADASEDVDDVGKVIEIVHLNNEKLVSGLHTILARKLDDKLLVVGFAGYLFTSRWIRQQIQRESQGTKVYAISVNRISEIRILFPKDIKEQQKITFCLSSIDELIESQTGKIEQLKNHKKGLMQGMFPEGA